MTASDRQAGHRGRLLQGMVKAVAVKGYADVTIADVVAAAGVSKRTFYEQFSSKQDCLLACFREASSMMQAELWQRAAGRTGRSRREQLRLMLDGYLAYLDRAPQLARTLLVEIQMAGAEGRRLSRESNLRMARLLSEVISSGRAASARPFDLDMALALIGGVNELVLLHAEDRQDEPFSTLAPSVYRFVAAALQA